MADDDKRWQDMNPDEQAVVIRQINGAVNGLQLSIVPMTARFMIGLH